MFIVIEGPDGCGKSSHSARLKDRLDAKFFKFPNKDSLSGKLIYSHLEEKWRAESDEATTSKQELNATVFQALQVLNRAELATDIIKAELSGNVVVDRYWPSGYAYGVADGLDGDYLVKIHEILPNPDLFILLDIDINDSIERRPERRDRYEADIGFMERVMKNYRTLWNLKLFPSEWVVVNARGTQEQTSRLIDEAIMSYRERNR